MFELYAHQDNGLRGSNLPNAVRAVLLELVYHLASARDIQ